MNSKETSPKATSKEPPEATAKVLSEATPKAASPTKTAQKPTSKEPPEATSKPTPEATSKVLSTLGNSLFVSVFNVIAVLVCVAVSIFISATLGFCLLGGYAVLIGVLRASLDEFGFVVRGKRFDSISCIIVGIAIIAIAISLSNFI